MVWYYADSDRQRGPVSDEEFQEMISNGRVRNNTLIWKDGMDSWQTLESARDAGLINVSPAQSPPLPAYPTLPAVPNPPSESAPGQATQACTQCGAQPLNSWNSLHIGQLLLCHKCDANLARYYQSRTESAPLAPPLTNAPAHEEVRSEVEYASIFERAGAVVIDKLVQSVILSLIMAITIAPESITEASNAFWKGDIEATLQMMRPLMIGTLVFEFLYHFSLVATCGASLGKMIFKIRVASPDGNPATFTQAFLRALLPLFLQLPAILMPTNPIAAFLQLVFLVGLVIALFDPQRRALYDYFARTRVIKNNP